MKWFVSFIFLFAWQSSFGQNNTGLNNLSESALNSYFSSRELNQNRQQSLFKLDGDGITGARPAASNGSSFYGFFDDVQFSVTDFSKPRIARVSENLDQILSPLRRAYYSLERHARDTSNAKEFFDTSSTSNGAFGELNEKGKDQANAFCSEIRQNIQDPARDFSNVQFLLPYEKGHINQIRNHDKVIRRSRNNAKDEHLLRVSRLMKHLLSKNYGPEPLGEEEFLEECNAAFENMLRIQPVDLTANLENGINHSLEKVGESDSGLRYDKEKSCVNAQNCLFTAQAGYQTNCNYFSCAAMGEDEQNQDIYRIASAGISADRDFDYKGADSFCNDCLEKDFELQDPHGNFDQEKKEKESELEDILLGRKVAQEIAKLGGMLELNIDVLSTHGDKSAQPSFESCMNNVDEVLFQVADAPCQNGTDAETYRERIKKGLSELGLSLSENSSSSDLFQKLNEKVNPENPPNSCSRGFYARYKKIQEGDFTNAPLRSARDGLLDMADLSAVCGDSGDYPEESFSDFLAEDLSTKIWNEVSTSIEESFQQLAGEDKTGELLFGKVCDKSAVLKTFCKDSLQFEKLNHLIIKAMQKRLFDEGDEAYDPKKIGKDLFEAPISSLLSVSQSMDPKYKVVMGSWSNICESYTSKKESRLSSFIEDTGFYGNQHGLGLYKKLEGFNDELCRKVAQETKKYGCMQGALDSNGDSSIAFSRNDIQEAKKELAHDPKLGRGEIIALNSLSCALNSKEPNIFTTDDQTNFLPENIEVLSDFDKTFALENDEHGHGKAYEGLNYSNFIEGLNNQSCSRIEGAVSLQAAFMGEDFQFPEDLSNLAQMTHSINVTANLANNVSQPIRNLSNHSSSSRLDIVNWATIPTFASVSQSRSFKKTASTFEAGAGADELSSVDRQTPSSKTEEEKTGAVRNAFSNIDSSFGASPNRDHLASSEFSPGRTPSSIGAVSPVKEPVNSVHKAEQLEGGVDGAGELPIGAHSSFANSLRGKSSDNVDLGRMLERTEQLVKENGKMREEMSQVKKKLEEKKQTQVRNGKGEKEVVTVPGPPSRFSERKDLVFNPRNSQGNEFVARTYMESQREQFSPDYSDISTPKRISLGEYSSKRRNAAKVPVEQVKNYNADIDRAFLLSRSSAPVDENFIKEYVEHVDRNSGSIEHLIVFENGVPAKIRIPDPQNEGRYLEHPIANEIAAEILERVEKDEQESFALYNMVNFGQSLQEFMQDLDGEHVSLKSLEARLEEMDEQLRN